MEVNPRAASALGLQDQTQLMQDVLSTLVTCQPTSTSLAAADLLGIPLLEQSVEVSHLVKHSLMAC
jgi:hypothetical protein